MDTNDTSRREFLLTSLLAGATLTGCSDKANPFEDKVTAMIKPSGKMVKLLSVDGEVIEVDGAFLKPADLPPVLTRRRRGIPGKKFVMVIDLQGAKCKSLPVGL
jgi:molybdopterin-containing oxidoreductase family iron-sulfur binding subunit